MQPAHYLMLDRNVVSALSGLDNSGKRHDYRSDLQLKEWLNHPRYVLSPILPAMEGRERRPVERATLVQEYERSLAVLETKLPNARFIRHSDASYDACAAILLDFTETFDQEASFLMEAAPLIVQRVADHRLQHTEDQLFELAHRHSIPNDSFILLLALSCLYEDRHGDLSIGRAVLKPKGKYTRQMAYNALSDIRGLHLLNATHALVAREPQHYPRSALLTKDKGLTAFWTAIKPVDQQLISPGGYRCNYTLSNKLLHRMTEEDRMTHLRARLGHSA